MNISELKVQLMRQMDLLDKNQLREFSGIVCNLVHSQYGIADWKNLSILEKEGILDSIKQLDAGNGIPHETIIKGLRN